MVAELLLEIGLIAVDLHTLRGISASSGKAEYGSNIIMGPAELINALPHSA